eukprot:6212982-Pleurochrysis_carterae.AAC.2
MRVCRCSHSRAQRNARPLSEERSSKGMHSEGDSCFTRSFVCAGDARSAALTRGRDAVRAQLGASVRWRPRRIKRSVQWSNIAASLASVRSSCFPAASHASFTVFATLPVALALASDPPSRALDQRCCFLFGFVWSLAWALSPCEITFTCPASFNRLLSAILVLSLSLSSTSLFRRLAYAFPPLSHRFLMPRALVLASPCILNLLRPSRRPSRPLLPAVPKTVPYAHSSPPPLP